MAGKYWNDVNKVAVRLKAHRLAGLLSLDLEGNNRVGAVHLDRSAAYTWCGNGTGSRGALAEPDAFAGGASYLVGHNIIEHDLVLFAKGAPDLALLRLPAIDKLYLSPLAFPENPYHHLVKQYQNPALARVQVNDSLLDAELTLELLADIVDALEQKDSDMLLTWHALLLAAAKGHGFDRLFQAVRGVAAGRGGQAHQSSLHGEMLRAQQACCEAPTVSGCNVRKIVHMQPDVDTSRQETARSLVPLPT